MTTNYKEEQQKLATVLWERRTEHERATKELDAARARQEEIAAQLRDAQDQLSRAVGPNLRTKMWIVRTGTAVIARYGKDNVTFDVLEAEPQE